MKVMIMLDPWQLIQALCFSKKRTKRPTPPKGKTWQPLFYKLLYQATNSQQWLICVTYTLPRTMDRNQEGSNARFDMQRTRNRLLHLIFFLQVKKFILASMYMEGTALPLLARKMCFKSYNFCAPSCWNRAQSTSLLSSMKKKRLIKEYKMGSVHIAGYW